MKFRLIPHRLNTVNTYKPTILVELLNDDNSPIDVPFSHLCIKPFEINIKNALIDIKSKCCESYITYKIGHMVQNTNYCGYCHEEILMHMRQFWFIYDGKNWILEEDKREYLALQKSLEKHLGIFEIDLFIFMLGSLVQEISEYFGKVIKGYLQNQVKGKLPLSKEYDYVVKFCEERNFIYG